MVGQILEQIAIPVALEAARFLNQQQFPLVSDEAVLQIILEIKLERLVFKEWTWALDVDVESINNYLNGGLICSLGLRVLTSSQMINSPTFV